MLKADNRLKAAVESCRPQVRATTPDIAEWVGYMVGWVWLWVDHSSVVEVRFIRFKLGGRLR